MIKRGIIIVLVLFMIINLGFISAASSSVESEFKKLANYAVEYETGNIDYIQLLVYLSSIREKINEDLGASGKEMGGILKEEQLKSFLGNPTEETKWVWSESEQNEKKLDKPVPAWRKLIFDGKKIQIRINSWPSIFSRKEFKEDKEDKEPEWGKKRLEELEGKLVYRLNFEIEFKRPSEQLDIHGKINDIKKVAQDFSSNPSFDKAEDLAKQSVTAEKTFQSYLQQSGGKCEDVMAGIFGTENKKQTQKLLVQEISFCEGDNFEVIARLEMCDECEWNWLNLNFQVEGRGHGFKPQESDSKDFSRENFENTDIEEIKEEIKKIINKIEQACQNKDFKEINSLKNRFWPLNEAWNKKSNDVWKELDKVYEFQRQSMSQEQRQEFDKNYGWIKQEQEKKQKAKDLMRNNYELRKQFYLNLFSNYEKKESYYTQVEFQKRLIEEFKEKGEEICDNNKDDNNNNQIDCSDEQCGGKICGKGKNIIQEGNETKEVETELYCIESECKAKEEIKEIIRNISTICQALPTITCLEGSKAFFSKYDNNSCPIETSCLKETEACTEDKDCSQPACGISKCLESKCEVTQLTECKELECTEGDEKICEDGKIVEICKDGFWRRLADCKKTPEIRNETIVGNECLNANDCGKDNVCNNGKCQVLPQMNTVENNQEIPSGVLQKEVEIIQDKEASSKTDTQTSESIQTKSAQQSEPGKQSEPNTPLSENLPKQEPQESIPSKEEQTTQEISATGNVIFNFIGSLLLKNKITGAVITGFDVGESGSDSSGESTSTTSESTSESKSSGSESRESSSTTNSPQESSNQNTPPEKNQEDKRQEEDRRREEDNRRQEENKRDEENRRTEEKERRDKETKERCSKECTRPCIEKCIKDSCGEELKCIVEESQKKCEESCRPEDSCIEKCSKGGDWWKEFQNKDEHKEEKGVFQVGGGCRTSQGKTESYIWFGGWGDPFEQIQNLKNKYYSGGEADCVSMTLKI
jgi:hypothetical protein